MVALHRSNSIHCPPFHTFVAWKYSLATHRHSRVTFPRVAACRCLYLEQLEIGSTRKRATGVRATAAAIPSITEAVGEERNRVLATMSRNRKKVYVEELEAKVAALETSVHQMRSENHSLKQECSSTSTTSVENDGAGRRHALQALRAAEPKDRRGR